MRFDWTPDKVDQLRELAGQHLSATEIGREMRISRNAVAGKCSRIKIKLDSSPRRQRVARIITRKTSRASYPASGAVTAAPIKAAPSDQDFDDLVAAKRGPTPGFLSGAGRAVWEAHPCGCRWSFGDPRSADFRFCGHRALPGLSYCSEHADQAITRRISGDQLYKLAGFKAGRAVMRKAGIAA